MRGVCCVRRVFERVTRLFEPTNGMPGSVYFISSMCGLEKLFLWLEFRGVVAPFAVLRFCNILMCRTNPVMTSSCFKYKLCLTTINIITGSEESEVPGACEASGLKCASGISIRPRATHRSGTSGGLFAEVAVQGHRHGFCSIRTWSEAQSSAMHLVCFCG